MTFPALRPLHLCLNCLQDGASPTPVGRDTGPQLDPIRSHLDLCEECKEALVTGDLDTFHARYATERTVRRPG